MKATKSNSKRQQQNPNAILPHISNETIEELQRRGLLQIDEKFWRLGDESNGTTRKRDGSKWKRADHKAPDWHKIIGLSEAVRNNRKIVLLAIEGSKDAVAAAEIAYRLEKLPETGILCSLGSGYRPIESEIEQLRGRHVVIIGDNDAAGEETAGIVAAAMLRQKIKFSVFDWSKCPECKDLYQCLAEYPEKCIAAFLDCESKGFSLLSSPSHSSTLQPFNPSTQQSDEGINEDEKLGIVCQFICTKKGTGNRNSFLLARSISNRKFAMTQLQSIFHLWWQRSRPFLPPDADEEKDFATFLHQLTRVRFTDCNLTDACERALKAKPPFIPARDGDEQVELLAALCREFQRDACDRAFICPVNIVQQFLNLRWPNQAKYLLFVLEKEGIIQCVDRGAPHRPGAKGKPTFWRYKLPLDQ